MEAMCVMLHLHAFFAAGVMRRHVHVHLSDPSHKPHTQDLLSEPWPE